MSLQYFKLIRKQNENAEEWMGCLRIKANECGYKEKDRRLKDQCTNGINGDDMRTDMIRELTAIKRQMESSPGKY